MDKEEKIPHTIKDMVQKQMLQQMVGNEPLKALGISSGKVVSFGPTEFNTVFTREDEMDFNFIMDNGDIMLLEFQSTYSRKDIYRFGVYNALVSQQFMDKNEVNTYIIYSAGANVPDDKRTEYAGYDKGSLQFRARCVYLQEKNVEEEIEKITNNWKEYKHISPEDELMLVFAPLMESKKERIVDAAIKVIEVVQKFADTEEQKSRITGSVAAVAFNVADEEYYQKIREAMSMSTVFGRIEKEIKEEGIKIGELNVLTRLIKSKLEQGKTPKQIQEELELSREHYLALIKKL